MAHIFLTNIVKIYKIYNNPRDIFKQMLAVGKQRFYSEKVSLNNVSFQLNDGEVMGIIGLNGSGKSTLVKILSGVLKPTHGKIEIEGSIVTLQQLIAGFDMNLTGEVNIFRKAFLYGMTKPAIERLKQTIIDFSDLDRFIDCPIKYYSNGMLLRLALSIVIHMEADIYLFDEALSVGDMPFQRKSLAKMVELKARKKIIVMVSHSISDLAAIADKVMLLRSGIVDMLGTPEEVIKKYVQECERDAEHVKLESGMRASMFGEYNPSGELTITEIETLNAKGKLQNVFSVYEKMVINVHFTVNRFVHNPLLRIHFHRNDGLWVWGNNSYRCDFETKADTGFCSVEIVIESINLLASTYYLSVGIWPDEYKSLASNTPIDIFCHKQEIYIQSDRRDGAGIVANRTSWRNLP